MRRVVVVHFNPPNLDKRLVRLTAAGHTVQALLPKGPDDLKALRADPPDAFVIDLDRRPFPKLGVRDGTTIRLFHAPDGFEKALRRAESGSAGRRRPRDSRPT